MVGICLTWSKAELRPQMKRSPSSEIHMEHLRLAAIFLKLGSISTASSSYCYINISDVRVSGVTFRSWKLKLLFLARLIARGGRRGRPGDSAESFARRVRSPVLGSGEQVRDGRFPRHCIQIICKLIYCQWSVVGIAGKFTPLELAVRLEGFLLSLWFRLFCRLQLILEA